MNKKIISGFRFSLFLSCLMVTAIFIKAQTVDETIKVESSLVVLNATITDGKGKPVAGLKQNQFQIFEDGKEQKIEFFAAEKTPFAAVILLDSSGSMEKRVSLARSAAIQFLDRLRSDDVTAIYNFDSKISLVQDFSNSRDIYEGVFDIKADGMTILNDAIFNAAQQLAKRPEKRRAIIVLSDGADTFSKNSADKALKAALTANATIYTVDMAAIDFSVKERMQYQGVLKNFAEKTGGKFISTPGGVAMREVFKATAEELGTQYTFGYQPTNTVKDGKWRTIEIKTSKTDLNIRTRKGYNATKN